MKNYCVIIQYYSLDGRAQTEKVFGMFDSKEDAIDWLKVQGEYDKFDNFIRVGSRIVEIVMV